MLLIPSSREDGQWTVLDSTGKSVVDQNFPDRQAAVQWIVEGGHTAYDSQAAHTDAS